VRLVVTLYVALLLGTTWRALPEIRLSEIFPQ